MDAQHNESGDRLPALDKETYEALVEMIGPDTPEVIIDLIDIYLEESSGLVETLKAGRGGEQDQAFLRAAHSLKSSSASVGGKALSMLAADLESHLRGNPLGPKGSPPGEMDIPLQVSIIVAEHGRVCTELKVERQRLADAG